LTDPKDIARIGSLILQASQTAVKAQIAVDDVRLRRKGVELLPRILEKMEEQRKRLSSDQDSTENKPDNLGAPVRT